MLPKWIVLDVGPNSHNIRPATKDEIELAKVFNKNVYAFYKKDPPVHHPVYGPYGYNRTDPMPKATKVHGSSRMAHNRLDIYN